MDTRYTRLTTAHHWLVLLLALTLLLTGLLPPVIAAPAQPTQNAIAPTYRVFATREGLVGGTTANGHVIRERDRFVALPSFRVLSSRGGGEFLVRVTYNGRSVVAPVWDVGPWNTDDRYWSPNRGQYPDLPIGLPQAQAAYFNGYNGGRDEFGRVVLNPAGIDLADGIFWDDLGMSTNDYVNVSFLWLGADPGPNAVPQQVIPAPPGGSVPAPPPPQPPDPAPPPGEPAPPAPAPGLPPAPGEPPLDNPTVPPGALLVDNEGGDFVQGAGDWQAARCGVNGSHGWLRAGDSTHRAAWSPSGMAPGTYEVRVYVPGCGESLTAGATVGAIYSVIHDDGVANLQLDQGATAGNWVSLGNYSFGTTTTAVVELNAATSDPGAAVLYDAVIWLPLVDSTAPLSQMTGIAAERDGFRLAWRGVDDLSGIAGYDVQVRQLPDGGWRRWLSNEASTSVWFGPHEGRDFAFRVRARDRAGNVEAWRDGVMGDIDSRGVGR